MCRKVNRKVKGTSSEHKTYEVFSPISAPVLVDSCGDREGKPISPNCFWLNIAGESGGIVFSRTNDFGFPLHSFPSPWRTLPFHFQRKGVHHKWRHLPSHTCRIKVKLASQHIPKLEMHSTIMDLGVGVTCCSSLATQIQSSQCTPEARRISFGDTSQMISWRGSARKLCRSISRSFPLLVNRSKRGNKGHDIL